MYIRTILKGSIGTTEVWSVSINWGIFGLAPDVADQTATDAIANALKGWLTTTTVPASLRTLLATGQSIDSIRVEQRAEDEHVLTVAESLLTASVPGTSGASKTPQDSLVLSLRTNTPGPSGRGRIYWPALGALLTGQFQMTTPTQAATLADTKTFLSGIGTQINAAYASLSIVKTVVLSVRSVKNHQCYDVKSIQVGSILDTQRRRRSALPETYLSVAYP